LDTRPVTYIVEMAYIYDPINEFAEAHPLSILEHVQEDNWWNDCHDLIGGYNPSESVEKITKTLLRQDIETRSQELVNGEWDAIQEKEVKTEITENKTVFCED